MPHGTGMTRGGGRTRDKGSHSILPEIASLKSRSLSAPHAVNRVQVNMTETHR